ncbi:hypothetical protein MNBD_GAMMA09-17 [hydrothermal vent metagenome]|uniref:Uncharacterized protein n=1 Tax=hydrothermal vent metagenome TaxID=652676 RepID=A0A3B0XEU2_9ZZZZ
MSEIKKHWESIYSNKSSLEVSGGASTLVDHLYDDGYLNLSVLDISANALACAQARLGHKAVGITWYEENVLAFYPPKHFS